MSAVYFFVFLEKEINLNVLLHFEQFFLLSMNVYLFFYVIVELNTLENLK